MWISMTGWEEDARERTLTMCMQFPGGTVPVWQAELHVHIVQLDTEGAADESDGDITSCQICMLPSKDFDGLWETLIYDMDVKRNLLDYAQTAMFFSDR